jgi:hypothetical protein
MGYGKKRFITSTGLPGFVMEIPVLTWVYKPLDAEDGKTYCFHNKKSTTDGSVSNKNEKLCSSLLKTFTIWLFVT